MTETEIRASRDRLEAYDSNISLRDTRMRALRARYDAEFEVLRRECDEKHQAIRRRRDYEERLIEMSFQDIGRIIEEFYVVERRKPAGLLTA